jgi:phosphate transport system substrate-binding protein
VTSLATSKSASRGLPANAPPRYRELVDQLDQASFNFYFNSGSDSLDNKALVDVGRLVDIMSAQANRSKKIVLVGFADSTGDPGTNQRLSENRAKAAASELEAQGIAVKDTLGFGQELPIRDNGTEAGREKNRRVEIFLTR